MHVLMAVRRAPDVVGASRKMLRATTATRNAFARQGLRGPLRVAVGCGPGRDQQLHDLVHIHREPADSSCARPAAHCSLRTDPGARRPRDHESA